MYTKRVSKNKNLQKLRPNKLVNNPISVGIVPVNLLISVKL